MDIEPIEAVLNISIDIPVMEENVLNISGETSTMNPRVIKIKPVTCISLELLFNIQ